MVYGLELKHLTINNKQQKHGTIRRKDIFLSALHRSGVDRPFRGPTDLEKENPEKVKIHRQRERSNQQSRKKKFEQREYTHYEYEAELERIH